MPAIAYSCKGPKDIVEHNTSGYLVETIDEMSEKIIRHFSSYTDKEVFSQNAILRAEQYQAEPIMSQFMIDMGLVEPQIEPELDTSTQFDDNIESKQERVVA